MKTNAIHKLRVIVEDTVAFLFESRIPATSPLQDSAHMRGLCVMYILGVPTLDKQDALADGSADSKPAYEVSRMQADVRYKARIPTDKPVASEEDCLALVQEQCDADTFDIVCGIICDIASFSPFQRGGGSKTVVTKSQRPGCTPRSRRTHPRSTTRHPLLHSHAAITHDGILPSIPPTSLAYPSLIAIPRALSRPLVFLLFYILFPPRSITFQDPLLTLVSLVECRAWTTWTAGMDHDAGTALPRDLSDHLVGTPPRW